MPRAVNSFTDTRRPDGHHEVVEAYYDRLYIVAFLNPKTSAPPRSRMPANGRATASGEKDLSNFDLRNALDDMKVSEISFAEFLAVLRKAGKHPA
jgi:hypothetical protein